MSAVDDTLVTDAVLALLRAELPDGVLVGDGEIPYDDTAPVGPGEVDPATGTAQPYAILYCIPPYVGITPGWAGQDGSEAIRFQVTTVGPEREAAQALATVIRGILTDRGDAPDRSYVHPLTVAGHEVMRRDAVDRVPVDGAEGAYNAGTIVDIWVHRTS